MEQKTARVIRHVHFEDLGTFASALSAAGYHIDYLDVGLDDLQSFSPMDDDLLVVLGGPIGVNDIDLYPFLQTECDLVRARLEADRPTLGICLGAQLMASALGANVFFSGHKEIGFSPLDLTEAGKTGPLRHLEDQPVLHWHGDMFDLPDGCDLLASTKLCAHQGFARGPNILGLQFHPEARVGHGFERWLIGHCAELLGAHIDPRSLRRDAARFEDTLQTAGSRMLAGWLDGLTGTKATPEAVRQDA